uniref:Uncharacterized protein n=1 Tax=Romanomermis culicivorax TaxID=13658 RepID=A0A915HHI6_ROMCU
MKEKRLNDRQIFVNLKKKRKTKTRQEKKKDLNEFVITVHIPIFQLRKILTDKKKREMADLFWTPFPPEAMIFHNNIAKACNHLHPEVGLPMG